MGTGGVSEVTMENRVMGKGQRPKIEDGKGCPSYKRIRRGEPRLGENVGP